MSDLLLPDSATATDLATYLARARRVDPDGAARLVAGGRALAVYVSPVHGGGGPTVLGLRVVPLVARADGRPHGFPVGHGRPAGPDRGSQRSVPVPLPPMDAGDAGWAGVAPPRSGWEAVGTVDAAGLVAAARAGIDEIAAGAGEGSGSQAVARLRALVWGRDLDGVPGVPAGVAFAAEALGFLTVGELVTLHAKGPWRRLSSVRGHVLSRRALL